MPVNDTESEAKALKAEPDGNGRDGGFKLPLAKFIELFSGAAISG